MAGFEAALSRLAGALADVMTSVALSQPDDATAAAVAAASAAIGSAADALNSTPTTLHGTAMLNPRFVSLACLNAPRLLVPLNALVVGSFKMAKKRRSTCIRDVPGLWSDLLASLSTGLGEDPKDKEKEAADAVKLLQADEGEKAVLAILEGNAVTRERMKGVLGGMRETLEALKAE